MLETFLEAKVLTSSRIEIISEQDTMKRNSTVACWNNRKRYCISFFVLITLLNPFLMSMFNQDRPV